MRAAVVVALLLLVQLQPVSSFFAQRLYKNLCLLHMSPHAGNEHIHIKEYPDDSYEHIRGFKDPAHVISKLQEITALRIRDVERSKKGIDTDGCGIDRSFYISEEDLEDEIEAFDAAYGKPLNLAHRIASTYPRMAIAAEFKKASPSKGDINVDLDPVEQALKYSRGGSAVISVLTEFRHFKGTLNDMKRVRVETQRVYGPALRPAVLRKDFILDRYQVLEARASGADTLLLIVAILGKEQLRDLITFSRQLGMEPLVEVNTEEEMEIALECGSAVVGVNNRNLHTFSLDITTTSRIANLLKKKNISYRLESSARDEEPQHALPKVMLAALSGITSKEDVNVFRQDGVSCVLVGETLMKSSDPENMIRSLLNEESTAPGAETSKGVIKKICGLTTSADASAALQGGANLIGVIFAPGSRRSATVDQARDIVTVVRKYGERSSTIDIRQSAAAADTATGWYQGMISALKQTTIRKPLVVGVFQNQSPDEVNAIVASTGVDLAQLHGDEDEAFCAQISVPCIKVLHMTPSDVASSNAGADLRHSIDAFAHKAVAVLIDSRLPGTAGGGTGKTFDWSVTDSLLGVPVILSGGLDHANVARAITFVNVHGVDVSSGVEVEGMPGSKDVEMMKKFLFNCK